MEAKNASCKHDTELFKTWDERSAYLLGYLEADGCFKIDGESLRIYFQTSGKDMEFLRELKKLTQFTGTLGTSINRAQGKEYIKARFTISSREWKKDLEKIGYRNEKIPDIPRDLMHHYIRGYFDGDGSIYFDKQVGRYKSSFVFSSKELALEFRKTLLEQGIKVSNVHIKTSSNCCWYFHISYLQTKKLGDYLYHNSTIFLKRKKMKFMKKEKKL